MERNYPYQVQAPCGKTIVYWSEYATFAESQASYEDSLAISDHSYGCYQCDLATGRKGPARIQSEVPWLWYWSGFPELEY